MLLLKTSLVTALCIQSFAGCLWASPTKPSHGNEHIIQLEPDADLESAKKDFIARGSKILNTFKIGSFRALVVDSLPKNATVSSLFASSNKSKRPAVRRIENNGQVSVASSTTWSQSGADWNLRRISHRNNLDFSNYDYYYNSESGNGVDIYIMDTGVKADHPEFQGRVVERVSFAQGFPSVEDIHGHGTHVAGTTAGINVGVAKGARIIGVKVLGDAGSGNYADMIQGIQWVVNRFKTTNRPAVINMSLTGGKSNVFNAAIEAATAQGVYVIAAAGNNAANACNFSPASATSAFTVASSDVNDRLATNSNFGSCVDIIAPGVNIRSSTKNGYGVWSGTSMAAPHVAGVMALQLSKKSFPNVASGYQELIATAGLNRIANLPAATPNRLLFNGWCSGANCVPWRGPYTWRSRSRHNFCIDQPFGRTNQGRQFVMWDCHGASNQQFSFRGTEMVIQNGGLCTDAFGSLRQGAAVGQWGCHGGSNQQFIYFSSDETIRPRDRLDLCLDIHAGSTANGAVLLLWTCHGGLNQRWFRA